MLVRYKRSVLEPKLESASILIASPAELWHFVDKYLKRKAMEPSVLGIFGSVVSLWPQQHSNDHIFCYLYTADGH